MGDTNWFDPAHPHAIDNLWYLVRTIFRLERVQFDVPLCDESDPYWRLTPREIVDALYEIVCGIFGDTGRAAWLDTVYSREPVPQIPPNSDRPAVPGECTVIGVSGLARAGKDEVANAIVAYYEFRGQAVVKFAFAKTLKEFCGILFKLSHEQLHGSEKETEDLRYMDRKSARWRLQQFGTEGMREWFGDDIWVNAIARWFPPGHVIVLSDTRFPNEARMIIDEYDGRVFRVDRPDVTRRHRQALADKTPVHASETSMDDFTDFAAEFVNDGSLEQLRDRVWAALEAA